MQDLPNGKGVKTFPDGSEYVGDFTNGQFNGYGTFRWSDGTVHEGHWESNKIAGEGIHTMADGTCLKGCFTAKKTVVGEGTKTWIKNGKTLTYKGPITNGNIGSRGVFDFGDGRVYEGDCVDGTMQGEGQYTWTDPHLGSATYIGGFLVNAFHVPLR